MISIKNISISYSKKRIINKLNLNMEANCVHGIVGLNGSGKTTLLNTIFGLKKYSEGQILFNNSKLTKKDIAYLPAENYFFENITGKEYLDLFKNINFETEKWNTLFTLPLDKVIDSYSTGMKKKLALFGIFKKDKPILILDEPFNGLDIETVRIIRTIILKIKETKTIIITSHILETLTNLCDNIHFLEKGNIKYSINKDRFDEFENKIFNSIDKKNNEIINELV